MRTMASRRFLFPLVSLVLAAACSRGTASDPRSSDAGASARNAATAPLLPTSVAELPTFDVDIYLNLLAQLRGTPVVVNVWASWCAPCKAEVPLLREASQTYGDRVQFLSVDILDTRDGARGFIADRGINYPSVFDPPGAIRDSLGMIGQPVTVFYDADGNVVSSWDGQLSESALEDGIQAALG